MTKLSNPLYVLLIVACGAGSAQQPEVVREGASVEDFEKARDECDEYVRANFNPHHAFDSPIGRTSRAQTNRNRRRAAQQMFERCMNRKGFEQGEVESEKP